MVTTQTPNIGRRSGRSHDAVLRAAMELCREAGYGGVTIEGIAARAGVGKQTIYRWWPSKGAVVLDAFMTTIAADVAIPATGDHLADIRSWLRSVARLLGGDDLGPHLAGLVGAKQSDPALAQAFHERVFEPIRTVLTERIRLAQADGSLAPVDPEIVADLITGPVWIRLLLDGEAASPDYAAKVLDVVFAALRP